MSNTMFQTKKPNPNPKEAEDETSEQVIESKMPNIKLFRNKTKVTRENINANNSMFDHHPPIPPQPKEKGFFDFLFG